jgi:hypothetical protein
MNKPETETVVTSVAKMTTATKIWDTIKNKKIEIFSLPNQFVHMHCKPIEIEPSKLYVTTTITAMLPALEELLNGQYTVSQSNKYICIAPL